MNKEEQKILEELEKRVHQQLENEGSGHDWSHIVRVTKTAKEIAEKEKADSFVVTAASLLHDLADDKVVESEEQGLKEITAWLNELGVASSQKEHILTIIQTISFKGGTGKPVQSLEAKVVQDADRLDAIGAIGIARCFVYAGSKGHKIDDPSISIRETMTIEEYRRVPSTAINHFYEKLLKLKDLMNTSAGRQEAERRHDFMEEYLEEFYRETRR